MNNQNNNSLLLFLKEPIPGKVKTRIAQSVGNQKACEAYEEFLQHFSEILSEEIPHEIHFAEGSEKLRNYFPKAQVFTPQCNGDLGKKMFSGIISSLKRGTKHCLIIGGDSPEITKKDLNIAFEALKTNDLVLGPTFDGGYWCIGMNQAHYELFKNMNWSTEEVFSETIQRTKSKSLKTKVLRQIEDIDTWESYQKWKN